MKKESKTQLKFVFEGDDLKKISIQLLNLWDKYKSEISEELETFFNFKLPQQIPISIKKFEKGCKGESKPAGITLAFEINRDPLRIFEVMVHEIIHYTEQINDRQTRRLLFETGLSRNLARLVDEAIISLLVPYGFLSKKLNLSKYKLNDFWTVNNIDRDKKARFKMMKFLEKPVKVYFEKSGKEHYVLDFLPKIIKLIKAHQSELEELLKHPLRWL